MLLLLLKSNQFDLIRMQDERRLTNDDPNERERESKRYLRGYISIYE